MLPRLRPPTLMLMQHPLAVSKCAWRCVFLAHRILYSESEATSVTVTRSGPKNAPWNRSIWRVHSKYSRCPIYYICPLPVHLQFRVWESVSDLILILINNSQSSSWSIAWMGGRFNYGAYQGWKKPRFFGIFL